MKFLLTLSLLTTFNTKAATERLCSWCVFNDQNSIQEIKSLSKMSAKSQLEFVKKNDVKIIVLESHEKVHPSTFRWSNLIPTSGELSSVTQKKALMGKTLCHGEHPQSKHGDTIVLSDVAPRSTLIHEYIHILQLRRDKHWCPLSKKLWTASQTSQEDEISIRNKEWDAHQLLWSLRNELNYDLDDSIAISSETIEEAQARKAWDPHALQWIKKEGVEEFMNEKIQEYMKSRVKSKKG